MKASPEVSPRNLRCEEVQINTKNKSFLKCCIKLKKNGVKDYTKPLTLYDKALVGVDPFDENLPIETKARIYRELRRNPWYFFREVVRFEETGNSDGAPFGLEVPHAAILHCRINNLSTFTTLPRQVGKTTTHVAFDRWAFDFGSTNTTFVYSSKSAASRTDISGKFNGYFERYPKWLQALVQDKARDKSGSEAKLNATNRNKMFLFAGANSDETADRMGRSFTTALVLFDELAFLERNRIIWGGMSPAFTTASQQAKKNNKPYGINIATTPNRCDAAIPHGFFAKQLRDQSVRFTYDMFNMNKEQLENYVFENSSKNMVLIEYDWKECGKDESWYESNKKRSTSLADFEREILLNWPQSDDNSIFPEEELVAMKEHLVDFRDYSYLKICDQKYRFNLLEPLDLELNYIISIDPSSGTQKDYTSILLIHPIDYRVVGIYKNNLLTSPKLFGLVAELMEIWLPNSYLIVERTHATGLNLLENLLEYKHGSFKSRIYSYFAEMTVEETRSNGIIEYKKVKKLKYGMDTSIKTRPLMFDMLFDIVKETPEVIRSADLYDDIRNLTYSKRGKIEAREGTHDDTIMSYLVARYSISEGYFFKDLGFTPWQGRPNKLTDSQKNEHKQLKQIASVLKPIKNNGFMEEISEFNKLLINTEKPLSIDEIEQELNQSEQDNEDYSFFTNINNILRGH